MAQSRCVRVGCGGNREGFKALHYKYARKLSMAQVSASRLRFFLFKQVVSRYLHYHNGQYSRYKEKIGKYETLERQANSQRHNHMEGRRDFRYKILAEYHRKPFLCDSL